MLDPAIEAAPLGDLRALEDRHLGDGLISFAARSALYRDHWSDAGVTPAAVRKYEDLQRLPYVRGADLREAWRRHPDAMICDPDVRAWFATSGTTGLPKWTPYGPAELALVEEIVHRAYYILVQRPGVFRCTIIATPAPFVSDAGAFALLASHVAARLPVEYLIASPTEAEATLRFLRTRPPTAIVGFPSILLRIAEGIADEAPTQARLAWRRQPSAATLAAVLATKLMRIKPRHLFKPEVGLFGGEPLAPYRQALHETWGLQALELYAMTEYPCFHLECREQAGMHLWADKCIPEIIPLAELEREDDDPAYVPAARHVFDATAGMQGEFVFTSFGRALPLVRYRTGDVIEVVDTARCACGRTHPRIRVRGRRDDLVNLGLIRFSTAELDQRLGAISGIGSWQLRIVRRGYKPQPILYLVPLGIERPSLAADAGRALDSIEALKLGVDNGLVLAPDIKIVPEIHDVLTWSGKRKRVIQEAPE
ncbi:MAG TPA: AMP-binding protein [bacterium]|jgi:phenylacetate-CoA ligase|nr:AMP-binding protein [bacterium]